jgi:hypothetical protein
VAPALFLRAGSAINTEHDVRKDCQALPVGEPFLARALERAIAVASVAPKTQQNAWYKVCDTF